MAEDHMDVLRTARARMVEDRRQVATTLAKKYSGKVTPDAMETLISIQNTIDAIDRAMSDEGQGKEPGAHFVR